jgi:endogenous inhibitor of DNA gyrase (YacG/DUF329 family)
MSAASDLPAGPSQKSAQKPPRMVTCPRCGAQVAWAEASRYRPFCSARCKGADLGAWANDEYRIAAKDEVPPDEAVE